MFNNLSDRLDRVMKNLKGEGSITELNIADTIKEVRIALLEADVNFDVARDFTKRVREKAIGEKVLTAVKPVS